jgi:general secretion pathway protein D
VKTILCLLLVTGFGLAAQTPPAATTNAPPKTSAPPAIQTESEALKRLLPPARPGAPVAPAAPAVAGPPAPAAAPSAPAAPTIPAGSPALGTVPAIPPAIPPVAPPSPAVPPAAATPSAGPAQPEAAVINYDWVGADLNVVLDFYANLVGRTIIRPAQLPANPIVLKTQAPLTPSEAKQALEAVLALNGIAAIPVGEKFVKVLPIAQAGGAGDAFGTNDVSSLPDLGSYQTRIVQLKYVKPSEVLPVIQPFASIGMAPPIAVESSQILVIRDNAENVKRMLEMIEKIDVTVPSEFVSEVIPIKFAKVEDIASALNSLGGGGGSTTVGAHTGPRTAAPTGAAGARPGQPYTPGALTPGTTGAGTPSSGASFSERIQQIIKRASSTSGSGELQILGVTKIVADARSNSLLVFATRQDMAMIKDIVSKLDVVLAQVLIETIIMDVSLDNSWALGVSASQQPKQFTKDAAGGGGYNNNNPFFNFLNSATNAFPGNFTGTLPPGFSYWGKIGNTWDLALAAAASDTRINVIQKPRIQTSHATPASIFIGGTVPYVSSTYYGGGYAGGPSSSYQQLPVGIQLDVTPFINQDGLVVMQISESIDELAGTTPITGVGDVPNTTSRRLMAEVAVRDGDTILLGGFIRNSDTKKKSGVPILKDIPLLGSLFSSRSNSKERKELIVLMRPTVLRTPELAARQVDVEKERLPGVRAAEADLDKVELGSKARTQEKSFEQVTPFTPEEAKRLGRPAPAAPAKP